MLSSFDCIDDDLSLPTYTKQWWRGNLLVSRDSVVNVWDPKASVRQHSFDTHAQDSITSVLFCAQDRTMICSGVAELFPDISVWDMDEMKIIKTLSNGGTDSLALLSSELLCAGSRDCVVNIWNLSDGKKVKQLDGHYDFIYIMEFAISLSILYSASDNVIRIHEIGKMELVQELRGHKHELSEVHFVEDKRLLISSSHNEVFFWDTREEHSCTKKSTVPGHVTSFFVNPTNTHHLILGSSVKKKDDNNENTDNKTSSNEIIFYDMRKMEKPMKSFPAHSKRITKLVPMSMRSRFASCSVDGSMKIWKYEARTGKDWRHKMKEKGAVHAMCYIPKNLPPVKVKKIDGEKKKK